MGAKFWRCLLWISGLTIILSIADITKIGAATQVEPGRFILVAKPGERITDVIHIRNEGTKIAEVSAVVYDWNLDEQDKLIVYEFGTRKDTLNGLIKFNPRRFKITPGETQTVRFTITAPEETASNTAAGIIRERRGIVFFVEEASLSEQGLNAKVVTEVGSTIYLASAPVRLKLRLISAKVEFSADGKPVLHMTASNEGSSHSRFKIDYKVINEKGALIQKGQTSEVVILPEFKKDGFFPLEGKYTPGKYNLLMEFKFFNSSKTLTHSIPFTVIK